MARATRGISFALCAWLAAGGVADAQTQRLSEGQLWVGRATALPPDSAAWQPVRLPDRWDQARRKISTEGWYKLRVVRPSLGPEPWAVYAPSIFHNGVFFVNGVEVGRGGRMEPPLSRNSFRPLYFAAPASVWRTGENWIQVRFAGTQSASGRLEPLFVGPASALLPRHARDTFFHSVIPQLSALLCVVLACALVPAPLTQLGGQRWFAAGLLCVAATTISAFSPDTPIPNRVVEWIVGSALHWAALLFAIAIARRWGGRLPAERFLLVAYVAFSVALAAVPPLVVGRIWLNWFLVTAAVMAYATFSLLRDVWQNRARGVALAGLAAISAMLISQILSARGRESAGGIASVVPVLFLLGFAGALLVTLIRALRESDMLSRTLDARVAERERELASSYEQLRAAERERALAEERARLMRDIHDGMGGKLVTALSLIRSGRGERAELEETLAEALDDLNVTIHSLRPGGADLPGVLGLLRARVERQARLHELQLDWAIGDAGEGAPLSPERVMHVLRIVQEAVANAVRHSGGSRIRIATGGGSNGELAWLEIADDGRGGAAPRPGGRGLTNLAQRSTLLGGALDIASDASGTRVRVSIAPESPPQA